MNKMFRRFLATGAAVVMLAAAALPAGAAAYRFRDVAQGTWYYNAVDYVSDVGLFSGTSADTFSPNTPMTRGMFVRVLANKAKIRTSDYTGSSFSDVKPGAWYASSVEWAAGNEIVSGIGGGRFAPNQSVTREQMALILYRYATMPLIGSPGNCWTSGKWRSAYISLTARTGTMNCWPGRRKLWSRSWLCKSSGKKSIEKQKKIAEKSGEKDMT